MAAGPVSERNQDATIYVGGLDEKVFPYQKKRYVEDEGIAPSVGTHLIPFVDSSSCADRPE